MLKRVMEEVLAIKPDMVFFVGPNLVCIYENLHIPKTTSGMYVAQKLFHKYHAEEYGRNTKHMLKH